MPFKLAGKAVILDETKRRLLIRHSPAIFPGYPAALDQWDLPEYLKPLTLDYGQRKGQAS